MAAPPQGESRYSTHLETEKRRYAVALYDYACVKPNDMTLKAGDYIELIDTSSPERWKGSCDENVGYFPASYVLTVSVGNQIHTVRYDFEGEGPGEIQLVEKQIVVVLKDNQDGWMYGRTATEEGLFPDSHTVKLFTACELF